MQIKFTMLVVGLLSLLGLSYYKLQKVKQESDNVKVTIEIKSKLGEGSVLGSSESEIILD